MLVDTGGTILLYPQYSAPFPCPLLHDLRAWFDGSFGRTVVF